MLDPHHVPIKIPFGSQVSVLAGRYRQTWRLTGVT